VTKQSKVRSSRPKGRGVALLVAAVSAGAGLLGGAGAAHADAQPGSGYYQLRNLQFGTCVTSQYGSTSGPTYMSGCATGYQPQWWNQVEYSNGESTLTTYKGQCLQGNVDGSVVSAPCNGSPFQSWIEGSDTNYPGTIRYYLDTFTTNCLYYCTLGADTSQPGRLYLAENPRSFQRTPSVDWTRTLP
jgi:hypothetical protein